MSRRAAWTALRWLSVAAMPGGPARPLLHLLARRPAGAGDLRRDPGRPLARPPLDAGDARDRRARGAAGACSRSRRATASPTTSPTRPPSTRGSRCWLILLAGIALSTALFAGLRRLERREGALTGRALALSRHPTVLKAVALAGGVLAIGVAIAVGGRAWDQFNSSDVQFPEQPAVPFLQPQRLRPRRLLAGRDRRLRRRADYRDRRRHLRVRLGRGTARSTCRSTTPTPSTWRPSPSSASIGGLHRPGPGRRHPLVGLLRLARRPPRATGAPRDRLCGPARLGGRARRRLVLGDRSASAPSSSDSPPVALAGRCAQLDADRQPGRRSEEGRRCGTDCRRSSSSPGSRRLPWSGRCWSNTKSRPARTRRRRKTCRARSTTPSAPRSIEPFAASPYVQLGLLAAAAGRIRRRDRPLHQRDRPRGAKLAVVLPALQGRARSGRQGAAAADLEKARELNPLEPCLKTGGLRVIQ